MDMMLLRVDSFSCYGCVFLESFGLQLASGGGSPPAPSLPAEHPQPQQVLRGSAVAPGLTPAIL